MEFGGQWGYHLEQFIELCSDVLSGGKTPILNLEKMEDDPQRRKPDITRARTILAWEPKVKSKR